MTRFHVCKIGDYQPRLCAINIEAILFVEPIMTKTDGKSWPMYRVKLKGNPDNTHPVTLTLSDAEGSKLIRALEIHEQDRTSTLPPMAPKGERPQFRHTDFPPEPERNQYGFTVREFDEFTPA